jgi:hypothetical protein
MKTLVALSGGPKSLVTAWLLKKQGMQVRGVYFDLLGNEALKLRMQEFEKRLGIAIQIVNVSESLGEVLDRKYSEYLKTAFSFHPKIAFHQDVLFPTLVRMRGELGCDRIATGHQVTLQEDLAAGLVRVVTGSELQMEEVACIATVEQGDLARVLAPIGAIPESMLQKLISEVAPPEMTEAFEVDWSGIKHSFDAKYADSFSALYQVYTDQGVLLESAPRSSLAFGGPFRDPANLEKDYRISDIRPWESRAIAQDPGTHMLRELQFDQGRWFSRQDLGLEALTTGMLWKNRERPVEVRLIQFENGKLKGVLTEILKGDQVTLFKGDRVVFMNGMEVLGTARVMDVR